MCENEKKIQELSDDLLDNVAGGASDTTALDEHNLPGGWVVTCSKCRLQFYVNRNKECPSCACKDVYMTSDSSKPIFDSTQWWGK